MLMFLKAFRPILSDFLATIVFIAFYAITGSIYAAIPLGIVLGGASLLTHDARFVMIKPSIGTFAIGCVMLSSNWLDRYLPPIVTQNVSRGFTLFWSRSWAVWLFVLAGANLYVAFAMGPKAWAWFNGIVPLA